MASNGFGTPGGHFRHFPGNVQPPDLMQTYPEPKSLLDGLCFPEGPRWHAGRLIFSDMQGREVVAVDLHGKRETVVRVPNRPSGLGFLPDGRLLIVSMLDRMLMRLDPSGLVAVADLGALAGGHCNDMVVDRTGRAYIGNFGFDFEGGASPAPTRLLLVTPDGQARTVGGDLLFPNGCVITKDERTLVVAETFGTRLTAFDIEADGSLSGQRLWAKLEGPPDGICLDAEGCIWVAIPTNPGSFLRVAEGGEIKARIDVPEHGAYACALGGPEGRTLFLLEAVHLAGANATPGNGRIRCVDVDVPS
jgi:sugar lactone lactonase YvrE